MAKYRHDDDRKQRADLFKNLDGPSDLTALFKPSAEQTANALRLLWQGEGIAAVGKATGLTPSQIQDIIADENARTAKATALAEAQEAAQNREDGSGSMYDGDYDGEDFEY